jgi:hypothetical protein
LKSKTAWKKWFLCHKVGGTKFHFNISTPHLEGIKNIFSEHFQNLTDYYSLIEMKFYESKVAGESVLIYSNPSKIDEKVTTFDCFFTFFAFLFLLAFLHITTDHPKN